jgi:hypothetical protein
MEYMLSYNTVISFTSVKGFFAHATAERVVEKAFSRNFKNIFCNKFFSKKALGSMIQNFFLSSLSPGRNKLECLSIKSFFHASLAFERTHRAGAYPSGASNVGPLSD